MGAFSKCQRLVLLRRRNKAIITVLVLTTLLLIYHSFNKDRQLRHSRENIATSEQLDVFVVDLSQHAVTICNEHVHPSTAPVGTNGADSADVLEGSESKTDVKSVEFSTEGILSPNIVRIKPIKPIVKAGDPLHITCSSYDPKSIHTGDSPYMNFELPRMSSDLESEVMTGYISDMRMVMLRINSVKKGHEGEYRCVFQSKMAAKRYNSVEVRVIGSEDQDERASKDERDPDNDIAELLRKGKQQQRAVDVFCQTHNQSHLALQLPEQEPEVLYRHLVLNDKTNTLFCFVPKAGCTNLKVLFFVALGVVPRSQLTASRDKVNQELLEEVQFAYSFLSRSPSQIDYTLKNYYKFIMYRNPLERLLSGYRSKVERFPLIGSEDNQPHYNWLRKEVWSHTHPERYKRFIKNNGLKPVNISFSDFITYWLTQPESLKIDEHFRSIFSLCEPCRVKYDYYGNFNNFNTDSKVLINKIHSSPKFLRAGYYSEDQTTGALTKRYYRQLTVEQRHNVEELLKMDLDFYYQLFPAEREINRQLLL